jgi:hypothetical protein
MNMCKVKQLRKCPFNGDPMKRMIISVLLIYFGTIQASEERPGFLNKMRSLFGRKPQFSKEYAAQAPEQVSVASGKKPLTTAEAIEVSRENIKAREEKREALAAKRKAAQQNAPLPSRVAYPGWFGRSEQEAEREADVAGREYLLGKELRMNRAAQAAAEQRRLEAFTPAWFGRSGEEVEQEAEKKAAMIALFEKELRIMDAMTPEERDIEEARIGKEWPASVWPIHDAWWQEKIDQERKRRDEERARRDKTWAENKAVYADIAKREEALGRELKEKRRAERIEIEESNLERLGLSPEDLASIGRAGESVPLATTRPGHAASSTGNFLGRQWNKAVDLTGQFARYLNKKLEEKAERDKNIRAGREPLGRPEE